MQIIQIPPHKSSHPLPLLRHYMLSICTDFLLEHTSYSQVTGTCMSIAKLMNMHSFQTIVLHYDLSYSRMKIYGQYMGPHRFKCLLFPIGIVLNETGSRWPFWEYFELEEQRSIVCVNLIGVFCCCLFCLFFCCFCFVLFVCFVFTILVICIIRGV